MFPRFSSGSRQLTRQLPRLSRTYGVHANSFTDAPAQGQRQLQEGQEYASHMGVLNSLEGYARYFRSFVRRLNQR
ncbi:hypothetical protein BT69DRAFT_1279107, partial [Atractiella rhizophila]